MTRRAMNPYEIEGPAVISFSGGPQREREKGESQPSKFTLTLASEITPKAGGPDDLFGKAKASGSIAGSDGDWLKMRRRERPSRA